MDSVLGQALGHLRQAAHQLLVEPDPTGQALSLATEILDIENLFEELSVEPSWVPAGDSAADSLAAAGQLLGRTVEAVPSQVWPPLLAVLHKAGDRGDR
jgi:hypothetical protein